MFSHSHDHDFVQLDEVAEVDIEMVEVDEDATPTASHHAEKFNAGHSHNQADESQEMAGEDGHHHEHSLPHHHGHHHSHHHGHHHDDHGHVHEHGDLTSSFLLLAVCALESCISGLALGVQKSQKQAFILFLAIITHIWAEAFALSASFLKANQSGNFVVKLMFGFSLITPVGIVSGILLYSILAGGAAEIAEEALVAFAAGIFLYVATFEIIGEEFESQQKKWAKWSLLGVGYVFMAVMGFIF